MNTGFNTMSIAHRIDEFVFDCSFDSLAQANALEPEMSTLLISGLLPVIDSILNEFDEADTVWRLDQVEIDLGDIANDDFHTKLMQCVQEKLREKLLRLQEHHRSPDSALIKQLPVQRLSKLQTDLEILRDFLLTGRMPWSIDTTDRYAHENMLQRILQRQEGQEAWITLLKRLTAAERAVAISRLVSQFSYRSLERVLAGISPVAANPLLDFLQIYQQAASAAGVKTAVQTERTRPAWEQLFKMLLESKPSPGNWAALLDQLIKTIVPQHTQESSAMLESINRTAAQYYKDGKISGAFHDALQTVSSLYSQHPQRESMNHPTSLTHRNGSHNAARSEPEGIKSNEEIKREAQPETAVSPGRKKHARQTEAAHEELYARIMEALQKAGLIDAGFASLLIGLPPIDRRQRLHSLLQSPAVKPRLPQLPQAALLDIGIWLSPQAALLNEHLLAHADKLQRSTATSAGSSRTQWEQRLWSASLNYLLAETDSDIVPAAYVQALARGVSDQADSRSTLRDWYDALEQNKTSAAIRTLLQTIAEASAVPPRMGREDEENPDSNRSVAGTVENAAAAQKPPLLDWDALLHRAQSTDDVREEIYIENAGQVLAAPYLPRLFSMLKLVEGGAFVDRHAAERAVHLLQFMVNEQTRSPEYQLTLNKILCGVKTGIPICAEIDISAHEQETIEGLIRGMIQNWKTIGNTSISGLRETFLQRKGKLQLKEDGMWYLTVEPGVFDMLLDSLPWSYSVIKHSWMERAVHVTWR